jgi:type II secretory pathway component PulF
MASFEDINNLFFRLSIKDKMLFARHMEMMTRSGMQVLESLEILKKQTTSKPFIRILDGLITDIKNGHYLSVAMERYRSVFGDFFINLIRVGETSGTLSENFKYLAVELGKQAELRSKIRGAMAYPIIILFATLGITAIMSFFIFPKILPVLLSLNVELPITTQIFIAVSDFMINYGVYLFLGLVLGTIVFYLLLRLPAFRFRWHRFIHILPLIGRMSTQVNIINLARTLNLLLKGGVKIVQALDITADTLDNLVYRAEVHAVALAVQRGEPMSRSLIDHASLFPPTFSQMCMVGENTGKLDETLIFLADFYEGELDATTKSMSNILEPALLIMMGGIVVFVAISIITPIYKISQSLGR